MSRPTRSTSAGRAYLDLQKKARRDRRPTDELLQLYALEGFLDRLTQSPYADRFLLKGGLLMAAFDQRRPTRDIDLQGKSSTDQVDTVRRVICEIADVSLDDGLKFNTTESTAAVIRDEEPYAGVRVTMTATLAAAKLTFHVDVNIGDPVVPEATPVKVPRLLGGEIEVLAHPLPMVYAEKIVTAIARGTASTRWRDFADIYLLSQNRPIDGGGLAAAIRTVAEYRQVELQQLTHVLDGYAAIAQQKWAAWRRKQQLDDRLPSNFAEIIDAVIAFGDPVVSGSAADLTWNPTTGTWT